MNVNKHLTYEDLIGWLTVTCGDDEKKLKQHVVLRENNGDFRRVRFVCKVDADYASDCDILDEGDIYIS